jgi:hypothetical protein
MKVTFMMLWMSLLGLSSSLSTNHNDCGKAHSAASYALFHAKKALNADNFDHQRYYAERSVEAFTKTQTLIKDCGCKSANNAILDGIDNLTKAANAEDWEKGRFYTKKGVANAQDLIGFIEECTSGENQPQTIYTIDDGNTDRAEALQLKKEAITEKQRKIEEAKKLLAQEEEQLKKELAVQQQQEAQRLKARKQELLQQQTYKLKAEKALQDFEQAITALTQALDCQNAYQIIKETYQRTDTALERENLAGTKTYYTSKAKEIAAKALEKLKDCATN